MTHVKSKFGFDTVTIGSITVYTCKIRIKTDTLPQLPKEIKVESYHGFKTMSFELLDYELAQMCIQRIGAVLQDHALAKLVNKYAWVIVTKD